MSQYIYLPVQAPIESDKVRARRPFESAILPAMTDIDAPMRYSDPVADRTGRDGGVGRVVL